MKRKRGVPDGERGGHRRYRLTGPVVVKGVVVERKARDYLREKRAQRWTT